MPPLGEVLKLCSIKSVHPCGLGRGARGALLAVTGRKGALGYLIKGPPPQSLHWTPICVAPIGAPLRWLV